MRVDVSREADGAWWDDLVRQSPTGTIYQTSAWADYARSYLQEDVRYVVCSDDGGQPLALLVLKAGAPKAGALIDRPAGDAAARLLRRLAPRYNWLSGPVFFGPAEGHARIAAAVFDEVAKVRRGHPLTFTLPHGVDAAVAAAAAGTSRSRRWGTFLVDLQAEEEALWESLRPSGRKAVRKAQADGLVVDEVQGAEGRLELHGFMRANLPARGGRCFPVRNLLERYRFLGDAAESIYVARSGERIVASLGIWRCGGNLHEFGSIQSVASEDRRFFGGDLIKWEVIRRESARGGKVYDLCGVNPEPSTPKEKGIHQFKKKWGGEYVEYLVFDS